MQFYELADRLVDEKDFDCCADFLGNFYSFYGGSPLAAVAPASFSSSSIFADPCDSASMKIASSFSLLTSSLGGTGGNAGECATDCVVFREGSRLVGGLGSGFTGFFTFFTGVSTFLYPKSMSSMVFLLRLRDESLLCRLLSSFSS